MRLQTSYAYGTSGKECYGSYSSGKGYGFGYENNCIHSGTIVSSGDLPTNWYNYALASAGTIIDKDTTSSNPATNMDPATESICPKGWTLPSKKQIDSVGGGGGGSSIYVPAFSPVMGGNYVVGNLQNENIGGFWWSSTAYDGARRQRLQYTGSNLATYYNGQRYQGFYIRCVQAP